MSLDNYWILPRYDCHDCTFRDILPCLSFLWLVGVIEHCPPVAACMSPSDTLEANFQGAGYNTINMGRKMTTAAKMMEAEGILSDATQGQ